MRWAGAWGVACVLLLGLSLVVALCACSNDLDALYGDGVVKDAGAPPTRVESLPPLPAQPDEVNRPECAKCAKQECAKERANCLLDDGCTQILACKGKCSHPACLQNCVAKYGLSEWYGVSSSAGAWYDDYMGCVFRTSCSVECNAGENFDCAGKYDWPSAATRFPVHLRFWTRVGLSLVGAEVRVCGPGSPCTGTGPDSPIASGRVDPTNGVTLNVTLGGYDPYFRGSFEVEDKRIGAFGTRERILPIPLTQQTELGVLSPPPDWLQGVTNGQLDLEAGAPLVIYVFDCIGLSARNVRVELPDLAEVEVLHFGDGWVLSEAAMTSVGLALVTDVPEAARGSVRVQAFQIGTALPFAEREIDVRAGWVTHLWWLAPRTR